jgi:hypothetical protein
LLPLLLPNRYWLPKALPCSAVPLPVISKQNSYTHNIVDFDHGIGVFSTNPSTYFSDGSTDFSDGTQKWHTTKLTTRKKQKHILFPGEKNTFNLFSFKLAIHMFWATKIGRKTKKIQNILQDKLGAEL